MTLSNMSKIPLLCLYRPGRNLVAKLTKIFYSAKLFKWKFQKKKMCAPTQCQLIDFLILPKFSIDGVEGVYVSNGEEEHFDEQGGQKGGQKEYEKTIDTILQLIKENPNITRNLLVESVGISPCAIQKHINHYSEHF